METLFDKYAGYATFSKIITLFYRNLLDSPRVSHYFTNIDLDRLIEHQTNFLAQALGGPPMYNGKDLRIAHTGLGITGAEFNEVVSILEKTLKEMKVERADIITILAIVKEHKKQIVSA